MANETKAIELNLREKGNLIESLWHAVNEGVGNLENIPGLVQRVIETEAWRERTFKGKTYQHARFIDFITTKPLAGCGWPPAKVEALIKDDPEILALWRDAVTPDVGANQHSEGHNNITTLTGTSKSYTLSRLKRDAPELFGKVVAGELTANQAAIRAGFRKKTISIPLEIEMAVKILLKHFTKDELLSVLQKRR